MMMQVLAAGGRQALTDGKRAADADNPRGYFEFERAMHLAKDSSWLPQARGKAVKIVAQLLPHLPSREHYNVILMQRDLREVMASQSAMLSRQDRRGAELKTAELSKTYAAQFQRVRRHVSRRRDMRMLVVDYAALLADPARGIDRIADFLGGEFDRAAAAQSVHPELRRQKHSSIGTD